MQASPDLAYGARVLSTARLEENRQKGLGCELTFSVLFLRWHPKKAALGKALKLKYLEIYDREHLFLRPDSESLTNFRS